MPHGPQIPLTPQTDERNFPRWDDKAPPGRSGHKWPRMLTRKCTKEDRDEWSAAHRKRDVNTREDYWEERPPKVGDPIPVLSTQELVDAGFANTVGEPVICQSQEDEELILDTLGMQASPPAPQAVDVPIPLAAVDPQGDGLAERLKRENAELEALLEKRRQLRAELNGENEPAPKKGGWPKGKPRKKAEVKKTLTLDEMAEAKD